MLVLLPSAFYNLFRFMFGRFGYKLNGNLSTAIFTAINRQKPDNPITHQLLFNFNLFTSKYPDTKIIDTNTI